MTEKPASKTLRQRRPGAATDRQRIHDMIRVDHAGEYGAVRIYEGQLAVLSRQKDKQQATKLVRHMADQELEHRETFNRIINERHVRPTVMTPLWHVAGFALGAATALLGEKAAMACTEAVEEVIDEHYQNQLDLLPEEETELKEVITKFRDEEIEHRDTAREHGAKEAPGYRLLSKGIRAGTRLAIKISERV